MPLPSQIIEKIKTEGIKPIPKWHFLFKQWFIWTFFGFSIALGAVAFSIILFQIFDSDWETYASSINRIPEFALYFLPYFWIILLIIFTGIAYYNFKHTESGYKYNVFWIAGSSLLISIALGTVLFMTGISERFESTFNNLPEYRMINDMRHQFWNIPERGMLAGEILRIKDSDNFDFNGMDNHKWEIDAKNAKLFHISALKEKMKIKIFGKIIDKNKFDADEIRPFQPIGERPILPLPPDELIIK